MLSVWIPMLLSLAASGADVPGVRAAYARLPLSFEANRGQTDPQGSFFLAVRATRFF
jgi:hypothetical protein